MNNGEIIQAGKYNELIQPSTRFNTMLHAHQEAISSISTPCKNYNAIRNATINMSDYDVKQKKTLQEDNPLLLSKGRQIDDNNQKDQLVQDEERERGKVGFYVYWSYLTCVSKGLFVFLACIAQCSFLV